ncbi:MAG TPA: outer membrane beta-barrel protein [Xanthobacteraceae bacterium]|jgi:hypothetical protein|nr:outer membrane beta-barrel protein [Xanthobacteraceae bacterium]
MPGNAAQANSLSPPVNPDTDLFLPSLQGNPNNPSRFVLRNNTAAANQAPPTGAFTGSAVPTAPPVYGSPTGFGAGNTGFDSTNARRRQRARISNGGTAIAPPQQQQTTTFDPLPAPLPPPPEVPSRPPTLAPPLPPEVYPSRAASRPGAVLPPPPDELPISNPPAEVHPLSAALRPGAVLPLPPPPLDISSPASAPPPGTPVPGTLPLGAVPRPTLPFVAGDPYEALGIRAGSFLILPAVELSTGYDSNPQHTPGGPGSSTFTVAPELHVRSDWPTNSFTADIVGSYYWYGNDGALSPPLDRPYLNSKLDGRIDVTRDTQILLENRYIISTDNPGSPNIQAGLAKLPINMTVGGTLGVEEQLGRFDATLKGTIDRSIYQNSHFTDGEVESNDDRAYDQYAGIFRLGYWLDPGFKPFVEVSDDTRHYDSPVDFFGEARSSTGASVKAGGEFKLANSSLVGEMAVGYLERNYQLPLPDVSGMTLDGSLLWFATGLTTVKFTAATQAYESTLQGVSASLSHDVSVEVDHALRRWLVATGTFGYGHDNYVGEGRQDDRYYAVAGLIYKLNPVVQVKGQLRHDWLTSTQSGNAYQSTSVLLTLRLQR